MTRQHRASRRHHRGRLLACVALAAVAAILTVSACSGSDTTSSAPTRTQDNGAASRPFAAQQESGSAAAPGRPGDELTDISAAAFDRSQIKTARIALRAQNVPAVVASVEQVASTEGGFIDSENTSTDTHGVTQSSSVTVRVPVNTFDAAVDAVSQLGQLASRRTTTQDVTGQVADVGSRVASARASILQLRTLFNRATKLGDIITLESQLSERESNLEALEAQQRALTDQTNLSTIAVLVTRPVAVSARPHQDSTSGFVGGLNQGWDALVTTFAAVAHALGAVLPLGIALAVLACLVWMLARRVPVTRRSPDRRPDTSG